MGFFKNASWPGLCGADCTPLPCDCEAYLSGAEGIRVTFSGIVMQCFHSPFDARRIEDDINGVYDLALVAGPARTGGVGGLTKNHWLLTECTGTPDSTDEGTLEISLTCDGFTSGFTLVAIVDGGLEGGVFEATEASIFDTFTNAIAAGQAGTGGAATIEVF